MTETPKSTPFTGRECLWINLGLSSLVNRWRQQAVETAHRIFVFDGEPFTGDWSELDKLCAAEEHDPLAHMRRDCRDVERLLEKFNG